MATNAEPLTLRRDDEVEPPGEAEVIDPMLPRKAPGGAVSATVPQTDTRRQGEKPKARGITLLKELSKLLP